MEYAVFAFRNKPKKVTVIAYKSGKVVIAGKGMDYWMSEVL